MPYCGRCDRGFSSTDALRQHQRDSPYHFLCYECPWDSDDDFSSQEGLDGHMEDIHNYCSPCDRFFGRPEDLRRHDVDKHNMCGVCGRYFSSPNAVRQHAQTHMPRDQSCIGGCGRSFPTFSAILLHLEPGACLGAGVDRDDINRIAEQSCGLNCSYLRGIFHANCPSCDCEFLAISALLQHVESLACEESPSWNRWRRFRAVLENNITSAIVDI
ncbi:ZnF C2H2 [Geosmithia morbida]|uniref:ZnF C2H2 n=1 Tax=Geosmithia morbida TaxID=1094350 RepID=A0A9P5D7T5_9HYPO|nr:ZnF C2H2 [Geosmithia morbida]KAF4126961.1 ZnF C2H2 [Geosmithia morbida]